MKTVSGHRDRLVDIIMNLEPDRRPRWGSLDVPRLICHYNDAMDLALGEIELDLPRPPLPRSWMKWMTVYSPIPWPRNLKIAKEFFLSPATTLDEDKQKLVGRIDRFLALDETHTTPHPLFGAMSWRDWDHMQARHFRWHLNQFGVDI